MGEWLPVAGKAETQGLDISAYWEGDPEQITRVSVRALDGDDTDGGGQRSIAAVLRVLRAYGADPGCRLEWEAGEGEGEAVAFVRSPS